MPRASAPLRSAPLAALLFAPVLGLGLIFDTAAGEVYQWKDANGVTHYSQTPPPSGTFKARTITQRPPANTAAEGDAVPESQQCASARLNVQLLESGQKLLIDTDNDGKGDRELDEKDRAQQLQLARMVLRVNCQASRPAGAPPPPEPRRAGGEQAAATEN